MFNKISDAELTYLELTAKHAPHELGTENNARLILLLLEENATLLDEYVCVEDLQDQLKDANAEIESLSDEIDELVQTVQELEEEVEELTETVEECQACAS